MAQRGADSVHAGRRAGASPGLARRRRPRTLTAVLSQVPFQLLLESIDGQHTVVRQAGPKAVVPAGSVLLSAAVQGQEHSFASLTTQQARALITALARRLYHTGPIEVKYLPGQPLPGTGVHFSSDEASSTRSASVDDASASAAALAGHGGPAPEPAGHADGPAPSAPQSRARSPVPAPARPAADAGSPHPAPSSPAAAAAAAQSPASQLSASASPQRARSGTRGASSWSPASAASSAGHSVCVDDALGWHSTAPQHARVPEYAPAWFWGYGQGAARPASPSGARWPAPGNGSSLPSSALPSPAGSVRSDPPHTAVSSARQVEMVAMALRSRLSAAADASQRVLELQSEVQAAETRAQRAEAALHAMAARQRNHGSVYAAVVMDAGLQRAAGGGREPQRCVTISPGHEQFILRAHGSDGRSERLFTCDVALSAVAGSAGVTLAQHPDLLPWAEPGQVALTLLPCLLAGQQSLSELIGTPQSPGICMVKALQATEAAAGAPVQLRCAVVASSGVHDVHAMVSWTSALQSLHSGLALCGLASGPAAGLQTLADVSLTDLLEAPHVDTAGVYELLLPLIQAATPAQQQAVATEVSRSPGLQLAQPLADAARATDDRGMPAWLLDTAVHTVRSSMDMWQWAAATAPVLAAAARIGCHVLLRVDSLDHAEQMCVLHPSPPAHAGAAVHALEWAAQSVRTLLSSLSGRANVGALLQAAGGAAKSSRGTGPALSSAAASPFGQSARASQLASQGSLVALLLPWLAGTRLPVHVLALLPARTAAWSARTVSSVCAVLSCVRARWSSKPDHSDNPADSPAGRQAQHAHAKHAWDDSRTAPPLHMLAELHSDPSPRLQPAERPAETRSRASARSTPARGSPPPPARSPAARSTPAYPSFHLPPAPQFSPRQFQSSQSAAPQGHDEMDMQLLLRASAALRPHGIHIHS